MSHKFIDNYSGRAVLMALSAADTTLNMDAANIPPIASGEYYALTLVEAGNVEIVHAIDSPSATKLTIVRAQEGTVAQAFSTSATCNIYLTAQGIEEAGVQVYPTAQRLYPGQFVSISQDTGEVGSASQPPVFSQSLPDIARGSGEVAISLSPTTSAIAVATGSYITYGTIVAGVITWGTSVNTSLANISHIATYGSKVVACNQAGKVVACTAVGTVLTVGAVYDPVVSASATSCWDTAGGSFSGTATGRAKVGTDAALTQDSGSFLLLQVGQYSYATDSLVNEPCVVGYALTLTGTTLSCTSSTIVSGKAGQYADFAPISLSTGGGAPVAVMGPVLEMVDAIGAYPHTLPTSNQRRLGSNVITEVDSVKTDAGFVVTYTDSILGRGAVTGTGVLANPTPIATRGDLRGVRGSNITSSSYTLDISSPYTPVAVSLTGSQIQTSAKLLSISSGVVLPTVSSEITSFDVSTLGTESAIAYTADGDTIVQYTAGSPGTDILSDNRILGVTVDQASPASPVRVMSSGSYPAESSISPGSPVYVSYDNSLRDDTPGTLIGYQMPFNKVVLKL